MQANTRTIKEILLGEQRFTIPPYQRPYVWSRERQWQPLWADIEDTVLRLSEARKDAMAKGKPLATADESVAPHFLGAIVVDELSTPPGEIKRHAVVDGQQRLTTSQLLIRGVLDALDAADADKKLRSQLRKLVLNDEDVVTTPETAFKVWPRKAERQAFTTAMDSEAIPDAEASRFAAGRQYFAEEATRWLNDVQAPEGEGDPLLDRAALLVSTLRELLKLVVIDLDGVDDAQVIFEVLNARHTPLTAADLVKNLLFLKAESEGLDVDALYETHWTIFDDDWWGEQVGTGHATRARQDYLLGDWLTARSAKLVSVGHLYGFAKTWIVSSGEKIPDILKSINAYAKAYRQLAGQSTEGATDAEQRAFRTIQTLRVTAASPLVLWLLTRASDVVEPEDRQKAIQHIESYLVRRMATKRQTRAYNMVFVELLQAAQRAKGSVADAIATALAGSPHGYAWPTDEDLVESFVGNRAYGPGGINQGRIRLLLGAVNHRLQSQSAKAEDVTFDYSSLTVEHVMPQKWEEHWPLEAESEDALALAKQERSRQVQRFGNLTLLTSALNPAVSNGSWAMKRPKIDEHTVLMLNKRVVTEPGPDKKPIPREVWDEDVIRARGAWLAEQVARVWDRPDDAPADASSEGTATAISDEDVEALHELLWESLSWQGEADSAPLPNAAEVVSALLNADAADDPSRLVEEAITKLIGNGALTPGSSGHLVQRPEPSDADAPAI